MYKLPFRWPMLTLWLSSMLVFRFNTATLWELEQICKAMLDNFMKLACATLWMVLDSVPREISPVHFTDK